MLCIILPTLALVPYVNYDAANRLLRVYSGAHRLCLHFNCPNITLHFWVMHFCCSSIHENLFEKGIFIFVIHPHTI